MADQKSEYNALLLVGGGHAHLEVIRSAATFRKAGYSVHLIDHSPFMYSGMASGMLGGMYQVSDITIDLIDLCKRNHVEITLDHIKQIHPNQRNVETFNAQTFRYDVLSLNMGSRVLNKIDHLSTDTAQIFYAKPLTELIRLRKSLDRDWEEKSHSPHIVVIGGGATGVELSANLIAYALCRNLGIRLTILNNGENLVPDAPASARNFIHHYLSKRNVQIQSGVKVTHISKDQVYTAHDTTQFDYLLIATGLGFQPPATDFGLPCSENGIPVTPTLEVRDTENVFAIGDCMDFMPRPLPKLGVFGVRATPVLLHNLYARLRGEPLRHYSPQSLYLSILNLGNGNALAYRGSFWWQGRTAMMLKHWLDTSFLKRYR